MFVAVKVPLFKLKLLLKVLYELLKSSIFKSFILLINPNFLFSLFIFRDASSFLFSLQFSSIFNE